MVAKQMHAAYAGWVAPTRASRNVLILAAAASLAVWALAEAWVRSEASVPIGQMHAAAASMVSAQAAIRLAKERRGLLQPPDIDPNRTGLIGPEWSEITTTLGSLPAKRTATNPDFGAALVRLIGRLGLPRGTPVVLVLSGSLVGANVASIIAVETLGLVPVVVSSLGASMYGATDPAFTWLDIEAELRAAGIIRARTLVAVVGGERGVGSGMDPVGRAALIASAARHDIPITEAQPLTALVAQVRTRIDGAGGGGAHLVINGGGSLIALGTCAGIEALPPGLTIGPPPCADGTRGLVAILPGRFTPVLHLLNMRALARELGLPYDPIPLQQPGRNRHVYDPVGLFQAGS